jgi:magnesium-transporting ATPase (P-type)
MYIGSITLGVFYILLQMLTLEEARTGIMFLISAFIWFNALNVRKNYDTIFSFNPLSNWYVVFGITLEACILLGSIYFVVGNTLFTTTPLPYELLLGLLFLASTIFIVDTLFKLGKRGLHILGRLYSRVHH